VLHGVPELVEGRLRLAGAAHAFAELPPRQRAFFSEYLADRSPDRRADVAARKQVQRLRSAMAKVADGFAAALAWLRLRFPFLESLSGPAVAAGFAITAVLGTLLPAHQYPADARAPLSVLVAGANEDVVVPHPGPQPPPAVPQQEQSVKPREERSLAATTAPPVSPPEVQERLRVEAPVGPTVGWEERPNEPDPNLVCLSTAGVGKRCVKQLDLPG
ncbi:MAG TPA: hypothetical protein VGB03_04885, partial [Acidimicrobiales bacterium]